MKTSENELVNELPEHEHEEEPISEDVAEVSREEMLSEPIVETISIRSRLRSAGRNAEPIVANIDATEPLVNNMSSIAFK